MNLNQLEIHPEMIKPIEGHECIYEIPIGFVPNMRVPGRFYATKDMADFAFNELAEWMKNRTRGLPSIMQIAFVSTLPGICKYSYGMPDMHSGYGFSIGGVAAFDTCDPNCIISPGGVGYDINCGVRCFTTHLTKEEVMAKKQDLVNSLYKSIPTGVGGGRKNFIQADDVPEILEKGAKWAIEKGYGVPDDLVNCEENGCMPYANPSLITSRAIARGYGQLGTLGSGNHYVEIQYIDEIFDERAAEIMGLRKGEVVCMIHTGSRGLGHQVATDFINEMERTCYTPNLPDKQLSAAPFHSELGQRYLRSMAAAANFAWCNRQVITHFARKAFQEVFPEKELHMDLIYDVAHNIAKIERHTVDGVEREFIVHRKGATRAFGPDRDELPPKYKEIGQPVLIGGSMGTGSYILVGTEEDVNGSFGSTCHGAGRLWSRTKALHSLTTKQVTSELQAKGVVIKAANKDTVIEEAPETYKDVDQVIEACQQVGVSKKVAKLIPIGVIKG